jgi:type II secretory pathway pseudopilin PulG
MSRQPRLRQHGLSLVELLLGLAITALVMAPLVPMVQTASAAARATGDQAALERDADFALQRIAQAIRSTDPVFDPTDYSVSNGTLLEKKNGIAYILAESVTGFSLDSRTVDAGQSVVLVTLTLARGNASTAATATVRMGGMQ